MKVYIISAKYINGDTYGEKLTNLYEFNAAIDWLINSHEIEFDSIEFETTIE